MSLCLTIGKKLKGVEKESGAGSCARSISIYRAETKQTPVELEIGHLLCRVAFEMDIEGLPHGQGRRLTTCGPIYHKRQRHEDVFS
jgi:hypothetical protein